MYLIIKYVEYVHEHKTIKHRRRDTAYLIRHERSCLYRNIFEFNFLETAYMDATRFLYQLYGVYLQTFVGGFVWIFHPLNPRPPNPEVNTLAQSHWGWSHSLKRNYWLLYIKNMIYITFIQYNFAEYSIILQLNSLN